MMEYNTVWRPQGVTVALLFSSCSSSSSSSFLSGSTRRGYDHYHHHYHPLHHQYHYYSAVTDADVQVFRSILGIESENYSSSTSSTLLSSSTPSTITPTSTYIATAKKKSPHCRPGLIYQDRAALDPYLRDWATPPKPPPPPPAPPPLPPQQPSQQQKCPLVLLPTETRHVQEILQYCHARRLPIVPQGGNTSLCGASVPTTSTTTSTTSTSTTTLDKDEHDDDHHQGDDNADPDPVEVIILSLRRMDRVYRLDAEEGVLDCQAGCILQVLQEDYASPHGWRVPLDLGSKGSCQLGGNLATNAGGIYFARYGSLAANVLGMDVVMANGRLITLGSWARKDNTGYKLQQLMVGSEGTLGIITRVQMQLHKLWPSVQTAWLILIHSNSSCSRQHNHHHNHDHNNNDNNDHNNGDDDDHHQQHHDHFDRVVQVRNAAQTILGETLAALEWMDGPIVQLVLQQPAFQSSLASSSSFLASLASLASSTPNHCHHQHILVETHGSNAQHDSEKMQLFLEHVLSTPPSSPSSPQSTSSHMTTDSTTTTTAIVQDGIWTQSESQARILWSIRDACNPSMAAAGYTYKYDISLRPLARFPTFIRNVVVQQQKQQQELLLQQQQQQQQQKHHNNGIPLNPPHSSSSSPSEKVADDCWMVGNWGHILDGNLHFNITQRGIFTRNDQMAQCLDRAVLEQVYAYDDAHAYDDVEDERSQLTPLDPHLQHDPGFSTTTTPPPPPPPPPLVKMGSISAEHGIGVRKRALLKSVHSAATLQTMHQVKRLLDPHCILNPGKVL